jgi:hypothetical protein
MVKIHLSAHMWSSRRLGRIAFASFHSGFYYNLLLIVFQGTPYQVHCRNLLTLYFFHLLDIPFPSKLQSWISGEGKWSNKLSSKLDVKKR